MQFDVYLFADYSGAASKSAQRRTIRLAIATRDAPPSVEYESFTREELSLVFVSRLRSATERGQRVLFGQDHQYGIPYALAKELGIETETWRATLRSLDAGDYGDGAPALAHSCPRPPR